MAGQDEYIERLVTRLRDAGVSDADDVIAFIRDSDEFKGVEKVAEDFSQWIEDLYLSTLLNAMDGDLERLKVFVTFIKCLKSALLRHMMSQDMTPVDAPLDEAAPETQNWSSDHGKRALQPEPEPQDSKRLKTAREPEQTQWPLEDKGKQCSFNEIATDKDSDTASLSSADRDGDIGEFSDSDTSSVKESVHNVHESELGPSDSNPPVANYILPHSPEPPALSPQRHEVSGRSIETSSAAPQPPSALLSASRNPPVADNTPPRSSQPPDVSNDASGRSVETSPAAPRPFSREASGNNGYTAFLSRLKGHRRR